MMQEECRQHRTCRPSLQAQLSLSQLQTPLAHQTRLLELSASSMQMRSIRQSHQHLL
jgi:hypothetical protein